MTENASQHSPYKLNHPAGVCDHVQLFLLNAVFSTDITGVLSKISVTRSVRSDAIVASALVKAVLNR